MNDLQQENPTVDLLEDFAKPMIYSKRAIWGFSILFSPIFGGILLTQNLKDIQKRKAANLVLLISILMTAFSVALFAVFNINNRAASMALNFGGAAILTECFYKKHFSDEASYEKKKIWKPLLIGISIFAAIVFVLVFAQLYKS